MQLLISIVIGVLCIAFIYFAFKHVNYHEKADNKTISRSTKIKRKK